MLGIDVHGNDQRYRIERLLVSSSGASGQTGESIRSNTNRLSTGVHSAGSMNRNHCLDSVPGPRQVERAIQQSIMLAILTSRVCCESATGALHPLGRISKCISLTQGVSTRIAAPPYDGSTGHLDT